MSKKYFRFDHSFNKHRNRPRKQMATSNMTTTTTSPIFQKFIVQYGADCDGTSVDTRIIGTYNDADEAEDALHEFREWSDGIGYHLCGFATLCRMYPCLVAEKWEIVPRELIVEAASPQPVEPEEDHIQTIFVGDEIRYRVPTGIEKRPFDGPFLGEIIGAFSKGKVFNVRRKDGPVEWVILANVSATFPKFK